MSKMLITIPSGKYWKSVMEQAARLEKAQKAARLIRSIK